MDKKRDKMRKRKRTVLTYDYLISNPITIGTAEWVYRFVTSDIDLNMPIEFSESPYTKDIIVYYYEKKKETFLKYYIMY